MPLNIEKLGTLKYAPFIETDSHDAGALLESVGAAGLALPEDYLQFLASFPNSGYFFSDRPVICLGDNPSPTAPSGHYLVSVLYAKCSNHQYDLMAFRQDNAYDDDLIPSEFLVIGDSDGGNYFCMDLREGTFGNICFYDHEHSSNETGILKIAENFTAFVDKLKESNV